MATDAIAVRVENLERRVSRIEDTNPAVIASELRDCRGDVARLEQAVSDLQSTILRSAIALCVALAGTSATIWAVFH